MATNYKAVDPFALTQAELNKMYYNVAAAINMRAKLPLNAREEGIKEQTEFFKALKYAKKTKSNLFTKQGQLKRQGKTIVTAANLQELLNIITTETVKRETNKYVKMASTRELSSVKRFNRFVEDVKNGRNTSLTSQFDEVYAEYYERNRVTEYWNVVEEYGYTEEALNMLLDGLNDILMREAKSKFDNDPEFRRKVDKKAMELYNRENDDNFIGPKSNRTISDYQEKALVDLYLEV